VTRIFERRFKASYRLIRPEESGIANLSVLRYAVGSGAEPWRNDSSH